MGIQPVPAPRQADKNYKKAQTELGKRVKKNKEEKKKRKNAAIEYGNTDYEFEIQNTLTEPTKKANTLKEGQKILEKTKKRTTSMDALRKKRNRKSSDGSTTADGMQKRFNKDMKQKKVKSLIPTFNKGGSAGSKLVASYYKGGKT
tara:strand:- start:2644 stop:3081 length:438 start_codon:yes stop_codon:yes gene_type:complete